MMVKFHVQLDRVKSRVMACTIILAVSCAEEHSWALEFPHSLHLELKMPPRLYACLGGDGTKETETSKLGTGLSSSFSLLAVAVVCESAPASLSEISTSELVGEPGNAGSEASSPPSPSVCILRLRERILRIELHHKQTSVHVHVAARCEMWQAQRTWCRGWPTLRQIMTTVRVTGRFQDFSHR